MPWTHQRRWVMFYCISLVGSLTELSSVLWYTVLLQVIFCCGFLDAVPAPSKMWLEFQWGPGLEQWVFWTEISLWVLFFFLDPVVFFYYYFVFFITFSFGAWWFLHINKEINGWSFNIAIELEVNWQCMRVYLIWEIYTGLIKVTNCIKGFRPITVSNPPIAYCLKLGFEISAQ